jgi:hypothetical protein
MPRESEDQSHCEYLTFAAMRHAERAPSPRTCGIVPNRRRRANSFVRLIKNLNSGVTYIRQPPRDPTVMKAGSSVELKGPETRKIWPFFIYEAIIDLQESAILGAAETIAIPM